MLDGMQRMYEDGEDVIYYITIDNENYAMPAMPAGRRRRHPQRHVQAVDQRRRRQGKPQGATVRQRRDSARSAAGQEMLAEKYGVSSNVWSVTSYNELRRDAQACRALEHAAPDREAAPQLRRKRARRRRRGRSSRRQRLRAGRARADRPVGARRPVRAGHRRLRPQRNSRRLCGGTSRSTPSASPSRRCISWPSKAKSTRPRRRSDQRTWASIRKRSTPVRVSTKSRDRQRVTTTTLATERCDHLIRRRLPRTSVTRRSPWPSNSSCRTWARTSSRATSSTCW